MSDSIRSNGRRLHDPPRGLVRALSFLARVVLVLSFLLGAAQPLALRVANAADAAPTAPRGGNEDAPADRDTPDDETPGEGERPGEDETPVEGSRGADPRGVPVAPVVRAAESLEPCGSLPARTTAGTRRAPVRRTLPSRRPARGATPLRH